MAVEAGAADNRISTTNENVLVAGPKSGQRIVAFGWIYNPDDTATATILFRVIRNGVASRRRIILKPDATWELDGRIPLGPGDSIRAMVTAGSPTEFPDVFFSYLDHA